MIEKLKHHSADKIFETGKTRMHFRGPQTAPTHKYTHAYTHVKHLKIKFDFSKFTMNIQFKR